MSIYSSAATHVLLGAGIKIVLHLVVKPVLAMSRMKSSKSPESKKEDKLFK